MLLINHCLALVNEGAKSEPGYKEKTLSPSAKNLLQRHTWPGNVRELLNTLQRASIWSERTVISDVDIREALLPSAARGRLEVLGKTLGNGFNLEETLATVATHYLKRAMEESGGNKTEAAKLVGLPSYQTLSNWLKSYKVSG